MDTDDLVHMLVEITQKKPHTVKGPEAERMYAQLEKECREIEARGGAVEVPHEIPDLE